ncbi:hypothetical protein BDD12DRAFT_947089 [Trichophaea hybrida]|nr:hypothetical protein BDD12DRAFT_947089 [Trichophaea hybrida]
MNYWKPGNSRSQLCVSAVCSVLTFNRENPVLQAEVAKLRQENDQLRAQLNRSPGQQMNSQQPVQSVQPPKSPDLSIISPPKVRNNPLKRKADTAHDEESRVRDFRRELNGRHGMPPPAIPIPRPSSNMPRTQQSSMLQHKQQAKQYIPRDNYEGYRNTLQQGNDLQQQQFFQRPNDRGFSYPQNQYSSNSHQGYQVPPQTPRQPLIPQDTSQSFNPNSPFRTPLPMQRTYANDPLQQDNRSSYLSPPTSRTGYQSHMNSLSSPTASRGRLSLAPQTSSGYPYPPSIANPRRGEDATINPGGRGASPFFSRPTSVASSSFGNNSGRAFQTPFLQRPQSAVPNPNTHSNGGLAELLKGSGGFMDRPGLRRFVRRD